jgi:import receptor subunit TOM22|tara:strand:+ start:671 stop:1159 length:489 start_codon:yes stop_codon:yes gene_type:complete
LEGEKEGKREKEGEKRSFFVKIVVVHSSCPPFRSKKKRVRHNNNNNNTQQRKRERVCARVKKTKKKKKKKKKKKMDIVPGTADSFSSKASKKSKTRDWEKTKEHCIRWAFSTGQAAWTFGTTFLVLVVPLIVQLHREEQMMEMEKEQMGVLADQQQQQQQQL